MAKTISSLSIVFPCLNDSGTISSMVVLAGDIAAKYTDDFEVIVVDDYSTDGSRELLDLLARQKSFLKVLKNPNNLGYGGAIGRGLYAARGDYVFYTDGDAQYDVRELSGFLDIVDRDTEVINGYKITRSDPWYRVILGKMYHHFNKLLFRLPVRDVDCDFRLFRRDVLKSFRLESTGGAVCVELVKKVQLNGFKFVEMPVHHHYRIHGKSQFFTFARVSRVLRELFALRFILKKEKRRLKEKKR